MSGVVVALIVTNCVLNVFFGLTCGLICYEVLKKRKQVKSTKPSYKR